MFVFGKLVVHVVDLTSIITPPPPPSSRPVQGKHPEATSCSSPPPLWNAASGLPSHQQPRIPLNYLRTHFTTFLHAIDASFPSLFIPYASGALLALSIPSPRLFFSPYALCVPLRVLKFILNSFLLHLPAKVRVFCVDDVEASCWFYFRYR
jgi:hypothetical protein